MIPKKLLNLFNRLIPFIFAILAIVPMPVILIMWANQPITFNTYSINFINTIFYRYINLISLFCIVSATISILLSNYYKKTLNCNYKLLKISIYVSKASFFIIFSSFFLALIARGA